MHYKGSLGLIDKSQLEANRLKNNKTSNPMMREDQKIQGPIKEFTLVKHKRLSTTNNNTLDATRINNDDGVSHLNSANKTNQMLLEDDFGLSKQPLSPATGAKLDHNDSYVDQRTNILKPAIVVGSSEVLSPGMAMRNTPKDAKIGDRRFGRKLKPTVN